ncbi:DEAD/DEAH box helicase [Alphaproteobacteria bacterium]|nr:DEAD/DEAH box helicase [Alphaproteobacteria bacterium]MDB0014365.1 DEAD/DEAH box helicase [Alphaproteobacteria bacterium]
MSDMNQDSAEISAQTPAVNFDSFGLPELMLATLAREGLVSPTPIQEMSIPLLLEGRDLIGLAQTGTGKTAAFLLPLMTHLGYSAAVRAGQPPKALILAPTRELANQIEQNVSKLSADLNIRHLAVFGGARYDAQIRGLRRGVDIVVATPGRLEDLMDRGAFDPSGITHFVLDEADHMLDLGFYPPIKRIAGSLPRNRQTMLFSATMPPEIETLAKQFLTDPAQVKAPQTGITADKVTQRVTLMAEGDKRDRLCDILNEKDTGQSLIFVRTKRRADALAKFMEVRGFAVDALHGDMRQTLRQKVLRNFRSGQLRALIATDVAARGIDVAGLSHVINFDLTDTPESYVHRIGRTGRAGLGGLAISFCAPDERNKLGAIIAAVGPRVELFELDGTPVTDFKAGGGASRGRRRPPQGARGRSDRPSRDDRPAGGRGRPERRDDRRDDRPTVGRGRPAGKPADDGDRRQARPAGSGRPEGGNRPNRDGFARRDDRPNRDERPRRDDRRDDRPNRDSRPNRDGGFKGRDDQARPARGDKPSFGDRPARGDKPSFGDKPARGGKPSFGDRPARGGKPSFGDKPARGDKPSFGDKPARGGKPFGSKPAFNKRPNFGDKPAAQKASSERGDGDARRASPAPKKRVGAARPSRNATPQGGQGTLKRRR